MKLFLLLPCVLLSACAGTATITVPIYKSPAFGELYLDASLRYVEPEQFPSVIEFPSGKMVITPEK